MSPRDIGELIDNRIRANNPHSPFSFNWEKDYTYSDFCKFFKNGLTLDSLSIKQKEFISQMSIENQMEIVNNVMSFDFDTFNSFDSNKTDYKFFEYVLFLKNKIHFRKFSPKQKESISQMNVENQTIIADSINRFKINTFDNNMKYKLLDYIVFIRKKLPFNALLLGTEVENKKTHIKRIDNMFKKRGREYRLQKEEFIKLVSVIHINKLSIDQINEFATLSDESQEYLMKCWLYDSPNTEDKKIRKSKYELFKSIAESTGNSKAIEVYNNYRREIEKKKIEESDSKE